MFGFFMTVIGALAIALIVALRRAAVSATGQPTSKEVKIQTDTERAREELMRETTPSGAEVRRLTNEELERAINRRRDSGR